VGRAFRLTPGYRITFSRLSVTWSEPTRHALRGTLRALTDDALPGRQDYEIVVPPTRFAWVRRVPGRNLWAIYTFSADEVRVLALADSPPVPLDRG
jgi:hypothetical protein